MRRARGYTVVEVMISLAVLAVGTSGIISMQKVVAATNREARNLALANQIARGWLDRLRTDATAWNHPVTPTENDDLGDTIWLGQVNSANGAWFRPTDNALGYAAADIFGNDVPSSSLARAGFCTNVRLTWLYGAANATPAGSWAIRAEVRVFWLREGAGGNADDNHVFCDTSMSPDNITANPTRYHFVYAVAAIPENVL